jgi:hypothetical protein
MAKLALAVTASLIAWGLHGVAARADGDHGFADVGSSASGIGAAFVSEGTATALFPLPFAPGGGDWRYRHGSTLKSLNETLGIAAAGQQIATLQVVAGKLVAQATSGGAKGDGKGDVVAPSGNGSIDSVQITLQLYPPPAGPAPAPLLSVVASGLAWSASDTRTGHSAPVLTGSTTVTSATVTGSLVKCRQTTASSSRAATAARA